MIEATVGSFYAPEKYDLLKLPLFMISISAGQPSRGDDLTSSRLDLISYLIKHPKATFYVTVEGDSMVDAGICPGDLLVVDRALEPQDGCVIIAFIDGEFTVKTFSQRNGKLHLIPCNKKYRPQEIKEESTFEVWGVVSHVIHKV